MMLIDRFTPPLPTSDLWKIASRYLAYTNTMAATFTNAATQTGFGKLPPELAKRIFDDAFAGRSKDVAACRLAFQELQILSSPYLIRTVVIAERLDALLKLRQVLQHPYFSQHVTTLVWDASYYEDHIATDHSRYAFEFEGSEHLATAREEAYIKAFQADDEMFNTIESFLPNHPRIPASLRGTGSLLEYGVAPPTDDEQGVPLSSQSRSQPEDVLSMSNVRDSHLYRHSASYMERKFLLGTHTGWADYHRRWQNQLKIRGGNWTADPNQAREYLSEVSARLPNLRNLVHSDFRALAYNGETYTHLCRRLFGNTVLPHFPDLESHIQEYDGSWYSPFLRFLDDVMSYGGTWNSISFGRHPFEMNHHDERHSGLHSGNRSMSMKHKLLVKNFGGNKGHYPMDVRSLSLPIFLGANHNPIRGGKLSTMVTDSLVELELGEGRFYEHWNQHKTSQPPQGSYPANRPESLWYLLSDNESVLKNLRSLSLRGFVFSTDQLQVLLINEVPALQTLHLLDCYCEDGYRQFTSAAQTAVSPNVKLLGVEIFGLRFRQLWLETENHENTQEYEGKLQERCAKEYEQYKWGLLPDMKGRLVSNWPHERPELENAVLGGKENTVVRKMCAAPNDEARRNWQEMPSRQD